MLGHEFKAEEVTVALGMLVKKKVIETVRGEDDSGYITSRYGITTAGKDTRWPIEREGPHPHDAAEREHVEHGNMPEWAQDDPRAYWRAADEHERANGSLYREVEFALPKGRGLGWSGRVPRAYTQHHRPRAVVLRVYQTAFADVAEQAGYHIDVMAAGIVSTFQGRSDAAGDGFLDLLLSDSIGSNLGQQDSRTYQRPARRRRH